MVLKVDMLVNQMIYQSFLLWYKIAIESFSLIILYVVIAEASAAAPETGKNSIYGIVFKSAKKILYIVKPPVRAAFNCTSQCDCWNSILQGVSQ